MHFFCILLSIFCMVEPERIPVHTPATPQIGQVGLMKVRKVRLIVPKIARADSFPIKCTAQPPPGELRRHYVQAARRYQAGATACELAKQGKAESGFNTSAVSPAGAVGVAQIMPRLAKEWGIDVLDPRSSIFGQARYVRWCRQRFPKHHGRTHVDIRSLGLGCYNWGIGNMRRDQSRNGWFLYREAKPHLPKETRDYVRKIEGR